MLKTSGTSNIVIYQTDKVGLGLWPQMEEVEEIEITEGAVGGIEINNGGADTNNTIEITDGSVHAENVMEGEMEEGGGGEGEHLNAGCTHNAVGVKERHAWAGRDYLTLDSAIGSESDSIYGLETGPTVTPTLGAHGISTHARRCVPRVWWQLGLHVRCWHGLQLPPLNGELLSTATWTPQSWCALSWVYLATYRGEKGRAMGKGGGGRGGDYMPAMSPNIPGGRGLREDNVRVTTQESGSGADEVVGAQEATEDMQDMFIQIVLKVRLAAREGVSARAPASLRACKTPAWVPELPPRSDSPCTSSWLLRSGDCHRSRCGQHRTHSQGVPEGSW
ncbi:hypothetical protein B0H16DRAFT_1452493 [Mycena metata]|uniref:Uncharacterized protein n=1 Tax=Mycena metata TaxID=1033252 RepID=A0AAD7JRL7_9AGAR|nr:hypothetical protein B0H16DRAFT_1452493 [Mycena metata]